MTIPFTGVPLRELGPLVRRVEDAGYDSVWSAEATDFDGITPLVVAAEHSDRLRLVTGVVNVFTRGPALLAQTAAALADLSGGRFVLGLGASSNVIVERWNGVPFEEPYKRVRDVVRFLKDAFSGEKVTKKYDTFNVDGFRLGVRPEVVPPVLVAALRPGMLRLAGREADGAIINWLSANDVTKVTSVVREAAGGEDREIVCRIFVCPSEDVDAVRAGAKMAIAAYLNVPVYAAFHDWLGRGETLTPMWEAWRAGDRKGALAVIPDSLVDELVVHGSPVECREKIQRYFENGVTTSSLAIMSLAPIDHGQAIRDLAPSAG
jgi:probable F420-dependent oxidoreductase